jgi:hypothetical protein
MNNSGSIQKDTFPLSERRILESIDNILRQKSVRATIDSIAMKVEHELKRDTEASLAWGPVPLTVYQESLPEMLRSSWVFAVRARTNTGAESHPNSHQRMMSYRGTGDLQIWGGKKWCSHFLKSVPEGSIEDRWVSVPPGVLHQALAPEENWIVVSFHTVPSEELIEERPDPNDPSLKSQRRYLD